MTSSDENGSARPMEPRDAPWEEEATHTFGPPKVRSERNRRYVSRLVRKHSEQTVRCLLKALSKFKEPMCCANLKKHDLESAPLDTIIRPYELLGLHVNIKAVSDTQVAVEIGQAYDNVGSGGKFLLERVDSCSYRVVEQLGAWIV